MKRWLAALCIAAALFYWPILAGGQTLFFRDVAAFNHPQAWLAADAMRQGRLPHWEPKMGFGYPLQADPLTMCFYPPFWLYVLFRDVWTYNFLAVFHAVLPAAFLMLLLARWGLSPPAAAAGGFTLLFSGYTASLTCLSAYQHGFAWMPVALYVYDGYLSRGDRRAVLGCALVLTVQAMGSDPQFLIFSGVLLLLAPWLRPGPLAVSLGRHAAAVGIASALVVPLAAVQFLPLLELASQSIRPQLNWSELAMYNLDPWQLVHALVPTPIRSIRSPYYMANFHGGEYGPYLDVYWGVPVLMLALSAFWCRPGAPMRRTALVAAAAVVVSIAMAVGDTTPFFGWVVRTVRPLLQFRFPGKYLAIAALLLPALAAIGFEGILRGSHRAFRAYRTAAYGLGALALTAAAGLLATGDLLPRAYVAGGRPAALGAPVFEALWSGWLGSWLAAAVLAAVLVWIARRAIARRPRPVDATLGVGLVTLADLVTSTFHGYLSLEDRVLRAPPPTAKLMATAGPGRPPARMLAFALSFDVDPRTPWTVEQSAYAQRELLLGFRGAPFGLNNVSESITLALAGPAGIFASFSQLPPAQQLRVVPSLGARYATYWDDSNRVRIASYDDALPRAFVVPRALPVAAGVTPSPQELLQLASRMPFHLEGVARPLIPRAVRKCEPIEYREQSLSIDVDVDGEGLLVVLDATYPGWRAHVDGVERELAVVAGAFRGVRVASGDRRVEMRFEPRAFRIGAPISAAALVLLLLLLPLARPGRSRAAPTPS